MMGGFGGMEVARSLEDQPVEVIMLDKHNYHTFQPLLYQVLHRRTGHRSPHVNFEWPSIVYSLIILEKHLLRFIEER